MPGSASYDNGTITFSVNGGGPEIWDTSDQFNYAYQELPGDGSIVAHVADSGQTSSAWALGGIMIRDGLSGDAAHASMVLATNGTAQWLQRDATGDSTTSVYGTPSDSWFKLTRTGDTLTGYDSADGLTWNEVSSATISMTGPVTIGLVANSGNNNAGPDGLEVSVTANGWFRYKTETDFGYLSPATTFNGNDQDNLLQLIP
jgi:regulation of enolase protein 1 (concanavalin A-like superfamily)